MSTPRKTKVKELTLADFNIYGSFANMINPQTPKLGVEPAEFYRDMVFLNLGQNNIASFSVCRVSKRPFIVDATEFHRNTEEGILPLDGDILMHVGLATPNGDVPIDRMEIFRVPKGTIVTLRPGVWHNAPFTYECDFVNVLIVLPERTYANDCYVFEIPNKDRIEIDTKKYK